MALEGSFYLSDEDPPAKRAILTAALRLFARDGIAGTNIRSIAAHAGYTNPALFKHFDGKESMALYLFERCYRQSLLALRAAARVRAPFAARMRAAVRGFAAFVDAHPEAFFFVHDNVREFWPKLPHELRRHSIVGEFRTLLRAGRREGSVARDVPIEIQLAAVTGFLFQVARASFFGDLEGGLSAQTEELEVMVARILSS